MSTPLLGVFGGSFDPIHLGQLQSLWEATEQLLLDVVHIIPCSQSPLKAKPLATDDQRMEMIQLSIEGQHRWKLDEREIARGGVSYTVDTLKSLHQTYPKHHLCLIMAIDVVEQLPQWNRWQELFSLAHLIVMTRPEYHLKQTPWTLELERRSIQNVQELHDKKAGGVCWTTTTHLSISSTQIRDLCGMGHVPPYLVPSKVADYIKQHQLYQTEIL
jgi:nicotinate-nucleotide adenylyltransferase